MAKRITVRAIAVGGIVREGALWTHETQTADVPDFVAKRLEIDPGLLVVDAAASAELSTLTTFHPWDVDRAPQHPTDADRVHFGHLDRYRTQLARSAELQDRGVTWVPDLKAPVHPHAEPEPKAKAKG